MNAPLPLNADLRADPVNPAHATLQASSEYLTIPEICRRTRQSERVVKAQLRKVRVIGQLDEKQRTGSLPLYGLVTTVPAVIEAPISPETAISVPVAAGDAAPQDPKAADAVAAIEEFRAPGHTVAQCAIGWALAIDGHTDYLATLAGKVTELSGLIGQVRALVSDCGPADYPLPRIVAAMSQALDAHMSVITDLQRELGGIATVAQRHTTQLGPNASTLDLVQFMGTTLGLRTEQLQQLGRERSNLREELARVRAELAAAQADAKDVIDVASGYRIEIPGTLREEIRRPKAARARAFALAAEHQRPVHVDALVRIGVAEPGIVFREASK